MANRLRCRLSSGDGRRPRPAATRWAMVPSPGWAIGGALGALATLMARLLAGGGSPAPPGHEPTARAPGSRPGFDGHRQPELARDRAADSTARARGGTAMVRDRRMMTLLVDSSGDGHGTTRPTGEVP